ncbi:hypothetical protein ABVV53_13465 [Novosphingobium sp. RD2P27]|uniref:Uncharacterized protein n=1 Tax=Novosphingobium kalidii TaxID=3230299 RepID=A0ABV2D3S6_9SPHN
MSDGGTPDRQRIENLPPKALTPEIEALFPIMLPPGPRAKGADFNALAAILNTAGAANRAAGLRAGDLRRTAPVQLPAVAQGCTT